MSAQTPVDKNSPLWLAWLDYQQTEEYANTLHWAHQPQHAQGSMWAAFCEGFRRSSDLSGGEPSRSSPVAQPAETRTTVTTGTQKGIAIVTGTHTEHDGNITISLSEYEALEATTKAELCADLLASATECERLRTKLRDRQSSSPVAQEQRETEREAGTVNVALSEEAASELLDASARGAYVAFNTGNGYESGYEAQHGPATSVLKQIVSEIRRAKP